MILSKRERYIAVMAIAGVALLVFDRYLLTPFLDTRQQLAAERLALTGRMQEATSLFQRRHLMARRWKDMIAGGLKATPAAAESQALHALRDWAGEAGFELASVKPQRPDGKGRLREITFQAAGTGPMSAVARFLWQIETALIPLRIEDLQLGARREGEDDLSLQLRLSTLYLGGGDEQ